MTVSYKQPLTSEGVNNRYMSRTQNTSTVGKADFMNPANATGPTDGSLHVAGGVGIEKDTYIGGILHVLNAIYGSNLQGTNTGDVTISEVGNTPNSKGATLVNQNLTLQPADQNNPGVVTAGNQTFGGDKTFAGKVVVEGNFEVRGTTTTLNTENLDVEDKNITVNKGGTDASAQGAGITVDREGTKGSVLYDDTLTAKWKVGSLGTEKEVLTAGHVQDINAAKTFKEKAIFDKALLFGLETNAALGGADATLSGYTKPVIVLTNAGLNSIANITGGEPGKILVLLNKKGSGFLIRRLVGATASDQIDTHTGKDLFVRAGAYAILIYSTDANKWYALSSEENPPMDVDISATDINWQLGTTFFKNISANTTFTFSNVADGKVISVVVTNTSGAAVTVTFPSAKKRTDLNLTVAAGKANVYTFVKSNGQLYVAAVGDLE